MNPREIGLIDNRNENLWNDLNKTHSIVIETSSAPYYSCYAENRNSIIYISTNDINIDSFTHELLHILIREKGIFFGSSLLMLIKGNPILSNLISDELLEHFGNCMDHIKMFPIYIELGFDKKKFIEDYEINKCTKSEINQLKDNFRIRNNYSKEYVDSYIGKYISIKADPKQHINYPKALGELKKIDNHLFQILELCVERWKEMPLESKSLLDDDYRTISFEFYQNLTSWAENKIFI